VGKVAEILQITHLLERKPKALSGGERQRVAIGRSIVRQPKVFLFDEPLSNLDASLRVQTRIELAKLHQELGTTMIYVTHDQVEAMTLGDRVAVFHGGHLEQVGAPLELYRHPASQFVAGFIGALRMNFLPCAAVPQLAAQLGGEPGMLIGIRPEHLRLVSRGEGYGATVTLIEQLGDAQIVHATLDGTEHALAIKLHGETRHALAPGSSIGFAPEEGHAFLFDAGGRAVARH
jgi:multiple sugar transport system ATP-binding protein